MYLFYRMDLIGGVWDGLLEVCFREGKLMRMLLSGSLDVLVLDRNAHRYRYRLNTISNFWLIQVLLLKWVVMVFPYFTSHTLLRQLYGVIFNYLNFVSLRFIPHDR